MNNEERLKEITSVIDSQKHSIREMSVNDAKWLIKRARILQNIIDAWIWIEAEGTHEDVLGFHDTVHDILAKEFI